MKIRFERAYEDGAYWQIKYADGRIEYVCKHGVGHGIHVHGCDGCCSRKDFPLSKLKELQEKDTLKEYKTEYIRNTTFRYSLKD